MSSNVIAAWTTAAALILTAIGWPVIYALNLRRDRRAKQRDLRIQYLIDSWVAIESVANRPFSERQYPEKLEQAIAKIQLFGTSNQIKLAQNFAHEFASKGAADLDQLLSDLRQELRKELGLDEVQDRIVHLRWQPKSKEFPQR